ncbi:hypothetical protein CSB37_01495 [bacterium DOLZORAL124_38_8]|nr:MAG: hypothetical protein CSB37_01495 [bacterium DOLZORAL124_38_8]
MRNSCKNRFPYLPEGRSILFCSLENPFLQAAKKAAETESLDPNFPTGAVLVQNETIIGQGANGSHWHQQHGCERKRLSSKTGEDYELCEGCHPKNHAEQKAIKNAQKQGHSTNGADLYLWGHWWCCHSCWEKMIENKIRHVYLYEHAQTQFKR